MKLEFSSDTKLDLIDGEVYLVTDPCYIFGDLCWDEFCRKMNHQDSPFFGRGSFTYYGDGPVLYSRTRYGDGGFDVLNAEGNKIGDFGVDAGLFCVISKPLAMRLCPGLAADFYCEFVAGPGSCVNVESERLSGFVTCDTALGEELELDCFDDGWEDESDMDDELDEEEIDPEMFDEPTNGLKPSDPLSGV